MWVSFQIATLVQHRSERPHVSTERTLRAIGRVGQAVSLAVERFVCVGETIGDDNPEIRQDMYEACKEARSAGKPYILFGCSTKMLYIYGVAFLCNFILLTNILNDNRIHYFYIRLSSLVITATEHQIRIKFLFTLLSHLGKSFFTSSHTFCGKG